jgi:hypothetical protein
MAITIDYNTYIINVPKLYTQFVSTDPQTGLEVRSMDIVQFAKDLYDVQDNPDGAWATTAYEYTAPKDVGGVQLAPVVLILSPYIITFEDGQYAVNLVNGNTNIQDKVTVNQVSIRPSNSVGNTFSDAINSQSFEGAQVWVDANDGLPGITFPRGTPPSEVDNMADAITIALRENLQLFHFRGTLSVSGDTGVYRYGILGTTPVDSIIIATALEVDLCTFEKCAIVGSVTGRGSYQNCSIGKTLGLTGVEGLFDNCEIAGNITLDALATEPIVFKDCISAIAGMVKPGLNCNGTAAGINFRRYAGGLAITNFNNPAGTMTLDLMGSEVSINSTNCTNGVIVARGVGRLIDDLGNNIPSGTWNGITIVNQLVTRDQLGLTQAQQDQLNNINNKSNLIPALI